MKRLRKQLEKSLTHYYSDDSYRVGRQHNRILDGLVQDLRHKPSLDHFVAFTSCLNHFYSTRLHAAVNKQQGQYQSRNEVIVAIAEKLKDNWKKGCRLIEEPSNTRINTEKVEMIRCMLKEMLDRSSYSFTTKVFHMLNNQYPILDRNVYQFMHHEGFKKNINFNNPARAYKDFAERYRQMMTALQWPQNKVDELDTAIWVHVTLHSSDYFPKRNKSAEDL